MGRCQVFSHPPQVKLSAVAGNHDLGFHSQMKAYEVRWLENIFNFEKLFSGKRINFAIGLALHWKAMVAIIVLPLAAEFLESSHKWKGSHQHQHCYSQCRDKQQFLATAVLRPHCLLSLRRDAKCCGEDAAHFKIKTVCLLEASRTLLGWC